MKSRRLRAVSILLSIGVLAGTAFADDSKDDIRIWIEFVAALKKGEITPGRMRPYTENLKEPLLGFLKEMREDATWAEWEREPEIHRVGDQVHFLIPLTFGGRTE
ncbi:MAG: hypothetical protein AB1715_07060 [Acidobacteriota bacterium]